MTGIENSSHATLHATLPAAWGRLAALAGDEGARQLRVTLEGLGLLGEVERLLTLSPLFVEQLGRHARWVEQQLSTDWLAERHWSSDDWTTWVQSCLPSVSDEAAFMAALRHIRGREYLRIVWRDFSHRGDLASTLSDVSGFADAAIRVAVAFAEQQLKPRFGTPIGALSGAAQPLVVLGMGKLGGGELNLSSDVDLIFCYSESGSTQGGRKELTNQEFFIKLGQSIIRYLDTTTPDGFVFRVDMRLRPWGDSGALVSSFDALELYYQEQGREWERYALLKARPITGGEHGSALSALIRPFVFRRYIDFGVIESLRDMKAMIMAEIRRQGLEDNVKRGDGGIREVEFIAQCLQLIHGGRQPDLQCRGLLTSLQALDHCGLLTTTAASELAQAYRGLRDCEHALQGMEDRQTQTLPADDLSRQRLAAIRGFEDWPAMAAAIDQWRSVVAAHFRDLISVPDEQTDADVAHRLGFADLGPDTLARLGFADGEAAWQHLNTWLESSSIRVLQTDGRQRVERFLPRLCEAAAATPNPLLALERTLPFVSAVSRRSAYLVLLEENPMALQGLVGLSARSPWVAEQLAARPELLEELLDPEKLTTAPSRDDIHALVRQQLLRIPESDLEAQMLALGRIKDAVVLRVAASELGETLPIMKVSDYLSFLAEVLLEHAIAVAKAELVARHGEPSGPDTGFAVIGYGKLGGIELSYGSDLDLVFIYQGGDGQTTGHKPIDNIRFYTRLAQRVVHVLSTRMATGRLYEVDLRLRPHGESGLVAVSLQGFRNYQLESAWVWEHQALVRTRAVAGDKSLVDRLTALRHEILTLPREPQALAAEVSAMRRRMLQEGSGRLATQSGWFDLKRDPGGIVDIEFVVQYLVLAHAHRFPALTRWSDNIRILDALKETGVLPEHQAAALGSAYLAYRSAVHVAALEGTAATGESTVFMHHLEQVSVIRDQWLPDIVGDETS